MSALPLRPDASGRFSPTVRSLALPADLRALPRPALHVVMAMRLAALFERAGRDPVGELTCRLRSVTAALEFCELQRRVVRAWPEPYLASRPCCLGMTPDETTLAGMIRTAAARDRAAFGRVIAGFVRADRHDTLFEACIKTVAALPAS